MLYKVFDLFAYLMYKIVLPAFVYKHCMCVCRAQGRHYLLELNLQMVVSCPLGVLQEQ